MNCDMFLTGFQGIPENSVEWDEDWDKFDDEGWSFLIYLFICFYIFFSSWMTVSSCHL